MIYSKIGLVGANGNLGSYILSALQSNPKITSITVLTRQSSKSSYPPTIQTAQIPDDINSPTPTSTTETQLTETLRALSLDALILSFPGSLLTTSKLLINAAYAAKIPFVIPADFGSCDSSDPHSISLLPDMYGAKARVREHLQTLAQNSPPDQAFSWTSVICGHFLDHGLQPSSHLMSIFLPERKSRVFDGGDVRFSCSLLRTVGLAVSRILTLESDAERERVKDRLVYIHSVSTTQNELNRAVERVLGRELRVEECDSGEFIREKKKVLDGCGEGDEEVREEVTEELVGVEGLVNADWSGKEDFVNEVLGLPEEGLEELVRESLNH